MDSRAAASACIRELGHVLAGTQIVVPLARREIGLVMLAEGRSVTQVMDALRVTRRTVERWRAGTR